MSLETRTHHIQRKIYFKTCASGFLLEVAEVEKEFKLYFVGVVRGNHHPGCTVDPAHSVLDPTRPGRIFDIPITIFQLPANMPPKRKRSDDDGSENAVEHKRYAYLKESVRRVPEKTIKAKWTTLPEPVQDKVRDLFHSIERPVIVRQPNERKRIEAQTAVQAVVRKYVTSIIQLQKPKCRSIYDQGE